MTPWRPTRTAVVLQGGGALGAYQAGVLEALSEHQEPPDWLVATSIGAINASLWAGNAPGQRVRRLREFWRRVATHWLNVSFAPLPATSRWQRSHAALSSMALGIPAFYGPRSGTLWWDWSQELEPAQASFYTTQPLRSSLEELIDLDHLNNGDVRLSLTAVEVQTGRLTVFDNTRQRLDVRHVLASSALPPGFPAVYIDGELFWDGGLHGRTPIDVLLSGEDAGDLLCFHVDLWAAAAAAPRTINAVLSRQKDIVHGTMVRANLDAQREIHDLRRRIHALACRIPLAAKREDGLETLTAGGSASQVHVVQLVLQDGLSAGAADEPNRDIDFDAASISRRRSLGIADTTRALRATPWKQPVRPGSGMVLHPPQGLSDG